ncbi:UNVERIFIED_ORG: hypothetical protein J2W19_004666 [Shinella zoogloeoides]|nr:hypothetical protein [Shinella zoogloeoides]
MGKLIDGSFTAWIDKMPGAGGALHVKGYAEVSSSGWSGSLEKVTPQGFNPNILLLRAILNPPKDMAADVMSKIELRFDERPAAHPYTQVDIEHGSGSVSVPVGSTE